MATLSMGRLQDTGCSGGLPLTLVPFEHKYGRPCFAILRLHDNRESRFDDSECLQEPRPRPSATTYRAHPHDKNSLVIEKRSVAKQSQFNFAERDMVKRFPK